MTQEWKKIGVVGVDSGKIMVGDPWDAKRGHGGILASSLWPFPFPFIYRDGVRDRANTG